METSFENASARKPETWRLFIAIRLPDGVKDELEKVQRELRHGLPQKAVRWTTRERFHLTLKFLGNVDAEKIPGLIDALREVCVSCPPLNLRAERIGFFPDIRFPRVIWAWVHDDKELLPKLQALIEAAVVGFTAEKAEEKFTGHVTLGRAKGIKRPEAEILGKLALGMVDHLFGEWTAENIELIRSELSSAGSRYTTLSEIPLAGLPDSGKLPK